MNTTNVQIRKTVQMHFKVAKFQAQGQTAMTTVVHKHLHANGSGLERFRATNSVC